MQIAFWIYDMSVLFLYIVTCTLSVAAFLSRKHLNNILVAAIFFVYSLDHLVTSMTEMIPSFATAYENIFLTVPSIKSLVYVFSFALMIMLLKSTVPQIRVRGLIMLYCVVIIFFLMIPFLPDSTWKSWLYFFPAQLFLFAYSCFGLINIKSAASEEPRWNYPYLKKLFLIMMAFSVIIALEDSFVIFKIDVYSTSTHIFFRSISEDIFRVASAVASIRITIAYWILKNPQVAAVSQDAAVPVLPKTGEPVTVSDCVKPELSGAPQSVEFQTNEPVGTESKDSKLMAFSRQYQLTVRESEIFALMLKNMTNQEICDDLFISLGTVKTHTHNIFQNWKCPKGKKRCRFTQNTNCKNNRMPVHP